MLLSHNRGQVRGPRRVWAFSGQVDPDREEVHGAGKGRECLALVAGVSIRVSDLRESLHSVHPDQKILETSFLLRQGEAFLLLLEV